MASIRCGLLVSVFCCALGLARPAESQQPRPTARIITIRTHEGTTLAFDLAPDGRSLVFDLLGELWQLPAAGGDARPLTDAVRDTAEDLDPSWSPDGKLIVFHAERAGRTGLWLLDPATGQLRQLTQLVDAGGFDGNAAWSPDGSRIAFARIAPPDSAAPRRWSRIAVVSVDGGDVRDYPVPDSLGNLRDPAWRPDGRALAVVADPARGSHGGRIWLIQDGNAAPLTSDAVPALAPAFAPDGRRLAFLAPDSLGRTQVWVMNLAAAGAMPVRLTGHPDVTATRVRWTGDGQYLVYSAEGRLWQVPARGGRSSEIRFTAALSLLRQEPHLPQARFPEPGTAQPVRAFMGSALSPDGRNVALLALGKLWVMPVGGEARAVADVPLGAHHLAWSADGRTVAWAAGPWLEQDLFATDLVSGATTRITALPGDEDLPAFSPDGRYLLFAHRPAEDTTVLRVVDARAREVADTALTRFFSIENDADLTWSPASDGVLVLTGGFGGGPTRGELLRLTGQRIALDRMPDSPLYPQWSAAGLLYLRHARLWRAPFDSAGMRDTARALGDEPAMYPSAAADGSVLYISEGGLRLRRADGAEQELGWPVAYTPPVPEPLLVRNARIIDGTGRPATGPRDLLLEGGRISRIGLPGSILPAGARELDAAGRWIMPGLMDLHAHDYQPALLPGFTYFGVTTVRDQGSPIGPLVSYADDIAAGRLDGPRVAYGAIQYYSDWAYDLEDGQGVEPEADPDHVSRAVELARIFGAQHIKTRTFRRWDINAKFIAAAHARGMRVTGHCAHPLPLVAAGMDAKEHAGFCEPRGDAMIYDDLVQLYRAAGIAVTPTIVYASFAVGMNEHPHMLDADSELAPFLPPRSTFGWMLDMTPARHREFTDYVRWFRATTGKLARSGVIIGAGTDIWQIPIGVHRELEELVCSGLSPLAAIRAATGDAARILGADSTLGTIAPGRIADLVILDADPAADIRNTRRILAVIEAGRLIDRAALVEKVRQQRKPR